LAPPQSGLPDDGQVMKRPVVVPRRLLEVGGGLGHGDIISAGQHPHAQALQQLRPLSIKAGILEKPLAGSIAVASL